MSHETVPHEAIAVDLTTCDREPIHVPGAIQPHGALLALSEPELTVQQASANLGDLLGVPVEQALGKPLEAVFGGELPAEVTRALAGAPVEEINPRQIALAGARFDAVIHRHQGVVILELEPSVDQPPDRAHHSLRSAIVRLQAAETRARLCEAAVREVHRLTGFERVMVYQFDEAGHGSVTAEIKADGLDAYLGLHYPASDIPRQARELYLRNWIRTIPDGRYVPSRLVPELRPDTGTPLDLSHSVLRSVSPIHLEYMANMGVLATMSISLIVRGRLWGLISCAHHTAPRRVPHAVRSDCELIGRLASQQLAALEDREVASRRTAREAPLSALAAAMRAGEDVLLALLSRPGELLPLFGAGGAAVVIEGQARTVGSAPPPGIVASIAEWIDGRAPLGVFSTPSLAAEMPGMEPSRDVASGVASFALPGAPRRRILWFRPEILRTVSWGGDPRKPVEDGGARLHPRRSFALWREEVRLRSQPWTGGDLEAAEDLRRRCVEVDLEKQVVREQRAVRARDDLVAVVSHDLKNPLNVIQMQVAILRKSAQGGAGERAERLGASVDRVQHAVDRMNALIRDLLDLARIEAGRFEIHRTWEPLADVIEEATAILRPLADARRISLRVEQPPGLVVALDRERIFQVLSNLLGNAVKFTPEGGQVTLSATPEGEHVLVAVTDTGPGVAESDVPRVFDRYWRGPAKSKAGAGLGLYIARGIVEGHGGRIWVERPSAGGASFRFTLPIAPRGLAPPALHS